MTTNTNTINTIKHLVIAGGGPLGLQYLGALQKLEKQGFWQQENIETIYGTSVGTMIGAFICLKYDWETLNKYIIERPWHDAFKVNARQILESYHNKGLFDKKFVEIIFKPLLEAKDLNINITLKEFYEYSKIDLHLFTFDLNKFETVELTHTSYPDLSLVQAITMSSAIPGIFMPVIIENYCYIDGGIMCNYPINQCLRDHPDKSEILGVMSVADDTTTLKNTTVDTDTSLLEYIICIYINTMNFIRKSVKLETIDNTVVCTMMDTSLSLESVKESIKSQELRRKWFTVGEEDGAAFLARAL
jgi:predicted acylesterase/phospholipase RssA